MTNTSALKDAIQKKGIKLQFIASELGISRTSLYKKIENQHEFKASEIKKISDLLKLSAKQQEYIFFA